jgi:uncharacterized protein
MKALLVFALFFPTFAVFSYFHFAANPAETQLWYTASKVAQFSLPILGILFLGMKRRWNFRFSAGEVKTGIASGLGILGSLFAFYFSISHLPFLAGTKAAIELKLVDFGASTPLSFLALAAFIAVAHSFLEEYYWRGFVFAELKSWLGTWAAVLVSSLGFTGHHVVVIHKYCPPDLVWVLVPLFSGFVFVGGLLWAWMYQKNNSLAGVWISHFFADVAILAVGAQLVFGFM